MNGPTSAAPPCPEPLCTEPSPKALSEPAFSAEKAPAEASSKAATDVLHALEHLPEWLPDTLGNQALFAAQEISTAGLGLQWTAVPGAPSSVIYSCTRPHISSSL